jgi:hypothetical protein
LARFEFSRLGALGGSPTLAAPKREAAVSSLFSALFEPTFTETAAARAGLRGTSSAHAEKVRSQFLSLRHLGALIILRKAHLSPNL